MTNKEKFRETYAQAFREVQHYYIHLRDVNPQKLIDDVMKVALDNIGLVQINTPAFELTTKRLGIRHTYRSIAKYLNEKSA